MGGKPTSKKVTAYIPEYVYEFLQDKARLEYRSMSNVAASILVAYVDREKLKDIKDDAE